ncbi:hypothetical protein [Amnibacterium kyonggiense]
MTVADHEQPEHITTALGELAWLAAWLEQLVAGYCYRLMDLELTEGVAVANSMDALLTHITAFAPTRTRDDEELRAVEAAVPLARRAWQLRSRMLHSTWGLHQETREWMRSSLRKNDLQPSFAREELRVSVDACNDAAEAFLQLMAHDFTIRVARDVASRLPDLPQMDENP